MKQNIATNPILMQAGCAVAKEANLIMRFSEANQDIARITTNGEITVKTTYNGSPKSETYSETTDALLHLQADANTDVVIIGKVTRLTFYRHSLAVNLGTNKPTSFISYEGLTSLNCNSCTQLTNLDLSANTALTTLDCSNCPQLTNLDLSANTALTTLNCNSCTQLASLDLSANTSLTHLTCADCPQLTSLDLSTNTSLTILNCNRCPQLAEIKYRATERVPSDNIADAIAAATATDGVVYLNSGDEYYDTVADAATAKGWTVQSIEA